MLYHDGWVIYHPSSSSYTGIRFDLSPPILPQPFCPWYYNVYYFLDEIFCMPPAVNHCHICIYGPTLVSLRRLFCIASSLLNSESPPESLTVGWWYILSDAGGAKYCSHLEATGKQRWNPRDCDHSVTVLVFQTITPHWGVGQWGHSSS